MELKGAKVLVTGASGFVGGNLVPLLEREDAKVIAPGRREYDLTVQADVRRMFADVKPDAVIHLAALVGGILVNRSRPADFMYTNMMIGTAVVHEAFQAGVGKLVTLMGGCSYPAAAPNPISESSLWSGYPSAESAPYGIAKASVALLCQSYREQYGFNAVVLVPGNIYGPHDNFDLHSSHVIPALIRKFIEARDGGKGEVVAWGSGKPVRDFVYIGDVAEAMILATKKFDSGGLVNISSGVPVSIRELVETVADITGYRGKVVWDSTKPDGQKFKLFDVFRMKQVLGYECKTSLRDGLKRTVQWFEANRLAAARP